MASFGGGSPALRRELAFSREPVLALQLAEIYCQRAAEADGSESLCATDLYYQAAGFSWVAAALAPDRFEILIQARQLYHSTLARMLVTGATRGGFARAWASKSAHRKETCVCLLQRTDFPGLLRTSRNCMP